MPIKTISESSLLQSCALCGADNAVDISALVLGKARGLDVDPDLVSLPPCATPGCGAQEVLKRTWDVTPDAYSDSAFVAQRRAVNALAQLLRAMGKSHASCKALHDAEDEEPREGMPAATLQGAGFSPKLPDRTVGERVWQERQGLAGDIHPSRRPKP
jgi:hypothetical protein